jgi:hypothetical protein
MDGNELLIGLGGLLLSVSTYFAGVLRAERRHARNDSEARITRVLDAYMAAARAGRANGFHGLVPAGVGTLTSDAEIRKLMDRIVQHGQGWDPRPILQGVDMHEFFKTAVERQYNFLVSGSAEALAAELKGKTANQSLQADR